MKNMNDIEKRSALEQDMDFLNKVNNLVKGYRNLLIENQNQKSEALSLQAKLEEKLKRVEQESDNFFLEKEELRKDLDHIKECAKSAFIDFLDNCTDVCEQNSHINYFNDRLRFHLNSKRS